MKNMEHNLKQISSQDKGKLLLNQIKKKKLKYLLLTIIIVIK